MKRWVAGLLMAAVLGAHRPLPAQRLADAPQAQCVTADAVTPLHLYGLWQLRLWPDGQPEDQAWSEGAILFERHPEYPGSVRGHVRRSTIGNDLTAMVSGDVEGGEFTLDESADGVRIDAVWTGGLPPQACGKEIRGVRQPAEAVGGPPLNFVLRKTPGWQ
ncbi:MAG: hypothetical protein ACLGG8_10585 [Gammaproteobacteria bacterium]